MASPQVWITLRINYSTSLGESLQVTGSGPFGDWKAPRTLEYSNGEWSITAAYPITKEDIEYKYFVNSGTGQQWEGGSNRVLHAAELKPNAYLEIRDQWKSSASPESTYLDSSLFRDVIFHREAPAKQDAKSTADTTVVRFDVLRTVVNPKDKVYVSGSIELLGKWQQAKAIPLGDTHYPHWSAEVAIPNNQLPFQYKYVIVRSDDSTVWEVGANRTSTIDQSPAPPSSTSKTTVFSDGDFRAPNSWRGAGVAVPVFSLRTKDGLGVGEFLDIKLMVDWAAATKMNLLQILPINDTTVFKDYRDSYPYSAMSVFALHPLYIRIEAVTKDPAILKEVAAKKEVLNKLPQIDYEEVMKVKTDLLHRIFEKESKSLDADKEYQQFVQDSKEWLAPYAVFCSFRDKYGTSDFTEWKENATVTKQQLETFTSPKSPFYKEILFSYFVQYHLHKQLLEASTYAKAHRVGLKGDLPIGVNRNSVDTWVAPNLFRMDMSTGAPPDAFADDGQNWGFPTYAWDVMAKDNYAWWRARLGQMARYFHAFRIDHILGFFRIWEIPAVCVTGLLGRFNPALPLWRGELANHGIWDVDRLCEPYIRWHTLEQLFGDKAKYAADKFLNTHPKYTYQLKPEYNTEKKVRAALSKEDADLQKGLFRLIQNVILMRETGEDNKFHPRIELQKTTSFNEYFFQRQEELWAQIGSQRLPVIRSCTKMLVCGEDLGMVPKCVPPVLNHLGILGLRIQRMPSDSKIEFYHPREYEYLTVCSTSSHDMSTLRGWWEEDRVRSQRFYNSILGMQGQAPYFCEAYVSKAILNQHMHSASMWAIFPIQDLMGVEADLCKISPQEQKINEPANPLHYWRYRMHINLEDLIANKSFNDTISGLVNDSARAVA